jgi:tetratricopeptide (TPR) repeat protein
MKSFFIFCLIVLLNISNRFCAQEIGCTPAALLGYESVDDLVEKAKEAGNNGEYKLQKEFALKAVSLSKKIEKKYKCYSIVAYWALSDAFANLGDFDGALKNSQEALNFCDKFKRDDCRCKSTSEMKIGTAYSAMGNDSLALLEFKKALDICKDEYGQKLMEAYILQATGSLELKTRNLNSAMDKLNKAENIVNELGVTNDFSQQILGRCYTSIGVILYKSGKCDDALPKLLTGLQIAKDVYDNKTSAICNYYIARIYDNKANYSEAIDNYKEAIIIAEKMGDTILIVDSYNFMGSIYTSTGKNDIAAEKVSLSFKLAKSNGYKKGMVDSYNIDAWNKKELFTDSNMIVVDILSQAKTALTMSMDIGYKEGVAEAYNNLETFYENKKEYKMAHKYAKLALSLADSIGYTMVVADALNDLGDICFKYHNNADSAIYYYKLSIEKAKFGSYNDCGIYKEGIVDSYNKIGNVYLKKKKKDSAFENFFHALEFAKEIDYEEGIKNAKDGISLTKGELPSKGKSRKLKLIN